MIVSIPFVLLFLMTIVFVLIGVLVVIGLGLHRQQQPPSDATHVQRHDQTDDEITIVGFSPMMPQTPDEVTAPPAEVEQVEELGETFEITFDGDLDLDESTSEVVLLTAVGQTHQGRRRPNNEDAYLVAEQHRLFVVADGMGGYAGGEIASKMAVDTINEAFDSEQFTGSFDRSLPIHGAQLVAAIQMANRRIWRRSEAEAELNGMGTTLISIRFNPSLDRVYAGHVGDSRLYRFRAGTLEQVSTDHTLENMGVTGRMAHQLTRALGIASGVEVDLITANCRAGDAFLLCSDGLNKMLKDAEIADVLGTAATPELAVETLIGRANLAGGRDNITAILVQVRPTPVADHADQPTVVDETDPGERPTNAEPTDA